MIISFELNPREYHVGTEEKLDEQVAMNQAKIDQAKIAPPN